MLLSIIPIHLILIILVVQKCSLKGVLWQVVEGGEIKENSIYFIDWTNKKPLLADLRKKYLLDSISFSFRVDNVLRDAINNRHLYDLVIIKGNEGYDAFKYNPDTFNPYNFGGTKMFAKGGSRKKMEAGGGLGNITQAYNIQEGMISVGNNVKFFNKGGGLYDNIKTKKGTFTNKAKNRGMNTKAFMKEVLANPENYTMKTRRQAQLMKNMM
jgi:hypothetical protein